MPETLYPASAEELRSALESAAAAHRTVELFGGRSKHLMGGPIAAAETRISTSAMTRILKYEPRDLTISVEAGIRYTDLSRELARNGQMIPLAGPWSAEGTMGGIVAANISESRRRGYGSARDLVIGMEFATLEGKLVKSGGMVVKNVAGLDMGKLMIGSFGTLAAIATLNFKLLPIPTVSRTLLIEFGTLAAAIAGLAAIRNAGLNPIAADVANPVFVAALSAQFGIRDFVLAVQFGGNQAVIDRCTRESAALCTSRASVRALSQEDEQRFWTNVAAATPRHLEKFQNGAVVRIHTPLSECGDALSTVETSGHAMAASGVVRAWFSRPDTASRWLTQCVQRGWKGVIETVGPAVDRNTLTLWPEPGGDFAIMKKIRNLFDPEGLLNRGRLYGHL
ncbi:MAG TPA: FAD-binding oxidoreductase [Bryobacteraceae bacterium]|nr:FAD-binding oxidoreductase [Bryobacteraceae bacterium]